MSAVRGIHRRLPIDLSDDVIRRFWSGVDKRGDDECWPWLRSCRNGYGEIKVKGSLVSAHRLSYVLHHGEPPAGTVVCHTCDNRICCNPKHLTSGTPQNNRQQAIDRGRAFHHRGNCVANAKFSDEFVRAIWLIHELTGWGVRRMAKNLDMRRCGIRGILERKTYKHLIPERFRTENTS